ncbi:MAG: TerC family protein [Flavobacteriales bacterium]|jgi:predicted tellurium resistance membrane protein TerC|nr:TerC family protein [Flavobacteriales bacterium]MBK7269655.1 TerC family protein [Flavobacteriales bacterium]MBK7753682.1 TerC family protein [Flavobacteriales bacterium]MBK9074658.1 TerC family protein [Flavobacteriales bacterium]
MDFDISVLLTTDGLIALLTLSILEIVLGIDNIIFISLLSGELPEHQRNRARIIGLGLAMFTRVALLLSLSWVMSLNQPWFTLADHSFSGRDLVLLLGGLYLIYKSSAEVFKLVELRDTSTEHVKVASFFSVIVQIVWIDIVLSLDSVITALGMSNQIPIMVLAVVFAVLIMMFASGPISAFVNKHTSVKVMALVFLAMVGIVLVIEGMGTHINKNYVYAAMFFSLLVESLNLRMRRNVNKRGPGQA